MNGSSLRERKKERTRRALLEAAKTLFHEKGYDGTTVDMIAESADVSRRTLFRYFRTKEALFFAERGERLDRFRAMLTIREGDETAFAAVRRAMLAMAEEYTRDRDVLIAEQLVVEASPALVAAERTQDFEWEQAIVDALLLRLPARADRDVRARVLAGAIFGTVTAILRAWHGDGGQSDLIESARAGLDLLVEGFGESGYADVELKVAEGAGI